MKLQNQISEEEEHAVVQNGKNAFAALMTRAMELILLAEGFKVLSKIKRKSSNNKNTQQPFDSDKNE